MEDIEMKEVFSLWKSAIVSTAKLIWKHTVAFSKWFAGEVKAFVKGATWITLYFVLLAISLLCITFSNETRHAKLVGKYEDRIDSLSNCIDSLDYINKNEILAIKAGEYHMTPHNSTEKITKDSVASLLKSLQAWYPDIIMAQIQTESCFGTSDVAKNANNLVGMKKTNKRRTTQIKNQDYKGYGMYNNWESCVIDRVMWDYACFGKKKPSRKAYVEHLNSCYAKSRQYGTTMDEYSKSYKKYL